MLEIENLQAGYGETRVIHDLSLDVAPGQVLAVLGRNGAGKSTTLKAVMGLLPNLGGAVRFEGRSLVGLRTFDIARLGIAYVPETRDIFPSLTVRENLELVARRFAGAGRPWALERVLALFPKLRERLSNGGTQLSGGEQQMLAIARALLMNPRLLILDEPTEGLAPIVVQSIHKVLSDLKQDALGMLLVEQNFGFATSLADEVRIIGRGTVVWAGKPSQIRADQSAQSQWLGV
ncbi:ABC transporter ATP-binding protein [Algihabitans albus]|uniref:ABC transporter ATP-binding protein n=1 Tax=Algihabitans albus TaxID=2164067 RepID=UPI0035D0DDB5